MIWEAIYDQHSISLSYVDILTNHYNNQLISSMWNRYTFCVRRLKKIYNRAAGLLIICIIILSRLHQYAEWYYQYVLSR